MKTGLLLISGGLILGLAGGLLLRPGAGKVYNAENGTVIYRSRMHAKTNRNFEIFSAEEFILLRSASFEGQVAA